MPLAICTTVQVAQRLSDEAPGSQDRKRNALADERRHEKRAAALGRLQPRQSAQVLAETYPTGDRLNPRTAVTSMRAMRPPVSRPSRT